MENWKTINQVSYDVEEQGNFAYLGRHLKLDKGIESFEGDCKQ